MIPRAIPACLGALGCVFLCSCENTRGDRNPASPAATSGTTKPSTDDDVVTLLKQVIEDDEAWDSRTRSAGGFLGPFRTAADRYKKFPVRYAEERLISRGASIVPTLLDIARDSTQASLHGAAWRVLERFEAPSVTRAMSEEASAGRIEPLALVGMLGQTLPVSISAESMQQDRVVAWIRNELTGKSYDEIRLDLLDTLMSARYEDGGLFPGIVDQRVLRWLNRIYDVDLDSWLAEKAPDALRFRQEQIAKGYDPVAAFDRLRSNVTDGLLREAVIAVFPKPNDQDACETLLDVVYNRASPLHPQPSVGWEQRLRTWYQDNRRSLRYDFSLLRFTPVTGTSLPAGTGARPTPVNTDTQTQPRR